MTTTPLATIAQRLDEAAQHAQAMAQLSGEGTVLTLAQAYEVQRLLVERRLARGATRIGLKMGFTSRAKMAQMGLSDLVWGRLSSDMLVEEGGTLGLTTKVHARVEPELCFLLARPLQGVVTPAQALAAVEAVAPAMEIIDSRYRDFKFSLPDVVADNASSSGLVLGNWHSPHLDFSNLGLIMSFDGRAVEVGSTAAILGDPIRALVAAARLAAEHDEILPAGSLVMAGGATAAVALRPGLAVRCEMQNLGSVCFFTAAERATT